MNKLARWFLFNGLFAALLVAGFVYGIEGAENVALFIVWVTSIISLFFPTEKVVEVLREKKHMPPIKRSIDGAFDVVVICFLVWHGAVASGIAYFVHFVMLQLTWEKLSEPKKSEVEQS